ncbi:MAG: NAD kinase [Pseudomonadota bacterium]
MYKTLAVVAAKNNRAQNALKQLLQLYDDFDAKPTPTKDYDLLVVIGGDGTMLHALHKFRHNVKHFYGVNYGTLGFLMNHPPIDDLKERLAVAKNSIITPLNMTAYATGGKKMQAIAFNEVSLMRTSPQIASFDIIINNHYCMRELLADGIMLATNSGSSAYNFSCGGPILPMTCELRALTPISVFRPKGWKGAVLPGDYHVVIDVNHHSTRKVQVVADFQQLPEVREVEIKQSNRYFNLLFDADTSLEKRLFQEQFVSYE